MHPIHDLALWAPRHAYEGHSGSKMIHRPGWFQIITPGGRPGLNEVLVGGVVGEPEAGIDAVCATFTDAFKWCVYPWTQPSDLEERLVRRGFEAWGARAMTLNTAERLSTRLLAKPVDESTEERCAAVYHLGWGGELSEHLERVRRRDDTTHFVVLADDEVVGAAATLDLPGGGYLTGAYVRPEGRGRGAYRALVAARLEDLRLRGRERAISHAREATSAPMLEHLGFETVFRYRICQGPSSKRP